MVVSSQLPKTGGGSLNLEGMSRPGTGWAGSTPSAKPSGHPWIISHNGAAGSVGWADLDLKLGVQSRFTPGPREEAEQ